MDIRIRLTDDKGLNSIKYEYQIDGNTHTDAVRNFSGGIVQDVWVGKLPEKSGIATLIIHELVDSDGNKLTNKIFTFEVGEKEETETKEIEKEEE